MKREREMMRRFSIAINNIDKVYCSDMTKTGVKESMLWLLYALDDGEAHSQRQICGEWGFPKTTLNTTIKQAEAADYLTLTSIPGKRREMNICLTKKGKAYAEQVLTVIYQAEDQAMEETMKQYSADFIDALDYFSVCLKSAFDSRIKGHI